MILNLAPTSPFMSERLSEQSACSEPRMLSAPTYLFYYRYVGAEQSKAHSEFDDCSNPAIPLEQHWAAS